MNIGVIGCGYWGPNLVRNFQVQPETDVVAVCDVRPERLEFIGRMYPSIKRLSRDDNDILKTPDIDAVVICTPVSTHHNLAMQALQNDKHVFVEKPFTATSEEAREINELASKKGLTVMVDHTFVYTGAVERIKRAIDSGELGDLYYFDSVRVNLGLFQHDVNVIWDLAPHDVSIMDYLLNDTPQAVSATGMAHFTNELENMAYISTYYPNNVMGHIHVNWLAPVKVRKTLICGSKKMVVYDDMEPSDKVKIYDRGVDFVHDREEIYDMLIQYRTGDMLAPKIDLTEALKKVAREFYDAVDEKRPPRSDGVAGWKVVQILEAANESIRNRGRMVELT